MVGLVVNEGRVEEELAWILLSHGPMVAHDLRMRAGRLDAPLLLELEVVVPLEWREAPFSRYNDLLPPRKLMLREAHRLLRLAHVLVLGADGEEYLANPNARRRPLRSSLQSSPISALAKH